MFEYSEPLPVLILDLHFGIPTLILNTESLGTTSGLQNFLRKSRQEMQQWLKQIMPITMEVSK